MNFENRQTIYKKLIFLYLRVIKYFWHLSNYKNVYFSLYYNNKNTFDICYIVKTNVPRSSRECSKHVKLRNVIFLLLLAVITTKKLPADGA